MLADLVRARISTGYPSKLLRRAPRGRPCAIKTTCRRKKRSEGTSHNEALEN